MQFIVKYKKFLPSILIIVLGFAIYSNSLHSSFQFDDWPYVANNKAIRDLGNFEEMWDQPNCQCQGRFVTFYTFALNYHFHKDNVFGYHLVNLIIHIINAILVFLLVSVLFKTPNIKEGGLASNKEWIALFTSLFFLVHPIQTEAVSYIAQRFTSLAAMFYLLSVILYLKGRLKEGRKAKGFYLFSFLSALLGMFSKEFVFTLPAAILLIEFIFLRRESMRQWFKKIFLSVYIIPFVVLLVIVPTIFEFDIASIFLRTDVVSGSHSGDILTSYKYFLTQLRVIAHYLRLIVLPMRQNLDYDFPLSQSIFDPATLGSGLLLLLIIGFAVKKFSKNILASFGIFFMFLALSVESSFIIIHHVIYEHRMYLPSVGLFLAISSLLFSNTNNIKRKIAFGMIVVLVFSCFTFQRNTVWQTEEAMWIDVIKKSPHKFRPLYNLGLIYINQGKLQAAIVALTEAAKRHPTHPDIYNNRGLAYHALGEYDLAFADYAKAIEINPKQKNAYLNRGVLYSKLGMYEKAIDEFSAMLEFDKVNYAARNNLENQQAFNNRGIVYAVLKEYDKALADFDMALKLDPGYKEAQANKDKVLEAIDENIK